MSENKKCPHCDRVIEKGWPRGAKVFLHSDKDNMWELGEEIGLREDIISGGFKHALSEICFRLMVDEDGSYVVERVDLGDGAGWRNID